MTDKEKQIQEQNFTDMILERPISFDYKGNEYHIYPLTLGKLMLMSTLFKELFRGAVNSSPLYRILRAIKKNKENTARILAYLTLNSKDEVFNNKLVIERTNIFKSLSDEELTKTISLAMQMDRAEEYIKETHIDMEIENLRRIQNAKKDKSSFHVGGKTIFGQIIDPLMERYGWSYDYVLWGISYANIKILQADKINEVYMTEQERKSVTLYTGAVINADDKDNDDQIDKELGLA